MNYMDELKVTSVDYQLRCGRRPRTQTALQLAVTVSDWSRTGD